MAASNLAPCAPDIFANGVCLAVVHTASAKDIEAWVRAVRGWSQVEKVDWHFAGGRGQILALGTPEEMRRVRDACEKLLPALNAIVGHLYPDLAPVAAGYVASLKDLEVSLG